MIASARSRTATVPRIVLGRSACRVQPKAPTPGTVAARDMKAQLLDTMDIKRGRGITIKANSGDFKFPLFLANFGNTARPFTEFRQTNHPKTN